MTAGPVAPTACLPLVSRLASYSTKQIEDALLNLYEIYRPQAFRLLAASKQRELPAHPIHDLSAPDSGYASAEEEDDEDFTCNDDDAEQTSQTSTFDIDTLRSDTFERDFAVRWLTAFAARSDGWVYSDPEEEDARARLVDTAASLLASFAGEEEEEALTRTFTFPVADDGTIEIELNDAPLLTEDHTSVGLQSWGSSIILAEQICMEPESFGLVVDDRRPLRVLELGAGTGLLSIVAGKLLSSSEARVEIVATDFHPSVLANLEDNVRTNFPPRSFTGSTIVQVEKLDWQAPSYTTPFDKPFDVILAADVVYHPDHARWIRACVEQLLVRPGVHGEGKSGTFWLIIPHRSIGRHAGMGCTVEAVFPRVGEGRTGGEWELAIVSETTKRKHDGVGRADEGGYTLFEIGWVPSAVVRTA